ncbi:MAG: hypothetical protein IJQ13_04575 [Prevotella sp.]|nr:hypothetical protein [Prevotella sp.]
MKCLVTRLNAVVDNDNLKKFDTLCVDISAPGNYSITCTGGTGVVSGGYFSDSTYTDNDGTTMELGGNVYFTITESKGKLEIRNMSNLSETLTINNRYFTVQLEEVFQNVNKLSTIRLGNSTNTSGTFTKCLGNLDDVAPNCNHLTMVGCQITCSADNLVKNYATSDNLTRLWLYATKATLNLSSLDGKHNLAIILPDNATGDIKYLADVTNTSLIATQTLAGNLSGSIEDYIARTFENARNDSFTKDRKLRIRMRTGFTNVTVFGSSIVNQYPDPSSPDAAKDYIVFTWNADWESHQDQITISFEN